MDKQTLPFSLGRAWIASGAFWILQLLFVVLFYTLGSPFGALSDLSNALTTLLVLPTGFALYRITKGSAPLLSRLTLITGLVGILSNSIASFLILLGIISFAQSLPPIVVGYAAFGVWLASISWLLRRHELAPAGGTAGGMVIGTTLGTIGLIGPSINAGLFTGGGVAALFSNPLMYVVLPLFPVGYFGYPLWVIWSGRRLLAGRVSVGRSSAREER